MITNKTLCTSEKTTLLSGRIRFLIFLIFLVGLGFLYREALSALSIAVLDRQDSSHGLFVPVISAYFLWDRINRLKEIKPSFSLLLGGIMIGLSLLFFFLSRIAGFQLSILSFLFITGAMILIFFGKVVFMETSFPLFFLVTMIPLPTGLHDQIAELMRAVNTWGSVAVTRAFGAPVHREGYDVYMPGLHLIVNYGCSGIRYLLSLFTFSIVYAVLSRENKWARVSLIFASIPLSIFAGIIRLSVVFLAAHYIDPYWAGHKPHVFLSWVVFAVILFGSIGVDQFFLRRQSAD